MTENTARITLSPEIHATSHIEDNISQTTDADSVDEKALVATEIESAKEKILELEKEIKFAEQQLQQVHYITFISHKYFAIIVLVGGGKSKRRPSYKRI